MKHLNNHVQKEKNHKTNTSIKSCPTLRKNPSLFFSNEGFLFYSVILSPASNTFLYNFVAFLQIDMDLVQ